MAEKASNRPVIRRQETQSYVPGFTAFGVFAGVVVHGMVNAMRRRPISYEPWWHVINAAAGGVMLNWVAHKYDGTASFMEGQMGSYSKLPSWAYGALNEQELDSELRSDRVAAYRATYAALAVAEESEFLAKKQLA